MKTAASWFWLLYGVWSAIVVGRVFGGFASWPWAWVLAPAWVPTVAFAAFALVAFVVAAVWGAWLRFWEWRAHRERLRLWRRIHDVGLREFFLERERKLRRQQHRHPADPPACRPPFHRNR